MEYFDDYGDHEVGSFASYDEAVATIEANLANHIANVSKVYRIDIPGKEETVIGIDLDDPAASKPYSDDFIMSVIDFGKIKSTAHLPVELLISGDKVYGLFYRFRIAINFPSLSMMGDNSFMKIMDSPDAAKEIMKKVASKQ